ncbi:MAG TPA: protein kinase [Saprospiraceae bacterium]|nr:protein kinase [Saprospiraceae bacterium]
MSNSIIDRYEYHVLSDKVGEGAFGKVYKAYDKIRDRFVALKVSEVIYINNKEISLENEIKAIQNIPLHKNIAFYESVEKYTLQNGIYDFAVMQFYPDGSLRDILSNSFDQLTEENKIEIIHGIIAGLTHLHNHNIIHRDLKPNNIMIVKYNNHYVPKIIDFGLSKVVDEINKSFTSNSFAGGTLDYSSPEQLTNGVIGKSTDIWSLGVIIYEVWTGQKIFQYAGEEGSGQILQAKIIQRIFEVKLPDFSSLPPQIAQFLSKCLIKDPSLRVRDIGGYFDVKSFAEEKSEVILPPSSTKSTPDETVFFEGKLDPETIQSLLGKSKAEDLRKFEERRKAQEEQKRIEEETNQQAELERIQLQKEAEEKQKAAIAAETARKQEEERQRAEAERVRLQQEAEEKAQAEIAAETAKKLEEERQRAEAERIQLQKEAEEKQKAEIASEVAKKEEESRQKAESLRLQKEAEERQKAAIIAEAARKQKEEKQRVEAGKVRLQKEAEEKQKAVIAAEAARKQEEERQRTKAEKARLQEKAEERQKVALAAELARKQEEAKKQVESKNAIPTKDKQKTEFLSANIKSEHVTKDNNGNEILPKSQNDKEKRKKLLLIGFLFVAFLSLSITTYKLFSSQKVVPDTVGSTVLEGSDDSLSLPTGIVETDPDPRKIIMEEEWEKAQVANTIEAYSTFIKSHSNSPFKAKANSEIKRLKLEAEIKTESEAWKFAQENNTIGAYQSYIEKFPKGENLTKAISSKKELEEEAEVKRKSEMEEQQFDIAIISGNLIQLEAFITKYPNSKFIAKAAQKMEEIKQAEFKKKKEVEIKAKPDLEGNANTVVSVIPTSNGGGNPVKESESVSVPLAVQKIENLMVDIPLGYYKINCTDCVKSGLNHKVNRFSLLQTEVTQEIYKMVMGKNPSKFKDCQSCPVENISYDDAMAFLNKLNNLPGNKYKYRLPSESEWEYAALGGKETPYSGGEEVDKVAWYKLNSRNGTQKSMDLKANGFKIYSMSGNVSEWCSEKIVKGGSWNDNVGALQIRKKANWPVDTRNPFIGFRIARN